MPLYFVCLITELLRGVDEPVRTGPDDEDHPADPDLVAARHLHPGLGAQGRRPVALSHAGRRGLLHDRRAQLPGPQRRRESPAIARARS